eukprot:10706764-Prorocentrum_lima.AAC.1
MSLLLLEDLDLTSCGSVSDEVLRRAAELERLRRLVLSQCSDVTDKGVAYLAGMIEVGNHMVLEETKAGWERVTGGAEAKDGQKAVRQAVVDAAIRPAL